jgi:YgiT-type zinc finger domain-containing protein
MMCSICRQGRTRSGATTVTLERDGLTFVVKNVPAAVCDTCGEEYLDEATSARLLQMAEEASASGVQVDIRAYKAA